MKGVILAGGLGRGSTPDRITTASAAGLRPPMIFYPLQTLINADHRHPLVTGARTRATSSPPRQRQGVRLKHLNYTYQEGRAASPPRSHLPSISPIATASADSGDNISKGDPTAVERFRRQPAGRGSSSRRSGCGAFGVAELKGDRVVSIEENGAPAEQLRGDGHLLLRRAGLRLIRTLEPSGRGSSNHRREQLVPPPGELACEFGRLVDRCRYVRVPAPRRQPRCGRAQSEGRPGHAIPDATPATGGA